MANPDRALPTAWQLLEANLDNHEEPCDFDHHGDCQAAGHSWCGQTAEQLRREHGVRCLSELLPAVIEHEMNTQPAAQQPTLGDLWDALAADESGVLIYALEAASRGSTPTRRSAARVRVETLVNAWLA